MSMPSTTPIVLCSAAAHGGAVRAALEQAGLTVVVRPLTDAAVNGEPIKLLLIDGTAQAPDALRLCRAVRTAHDDFAVPILFLAPSAQEESFVSGLEAGADLCLPWSGNPAALVAQTRALLRIKDRHDQLAIRAADAQRLSQRLQTAYQQIDQELELASRLHECFLPHSLPDLPRVRCAVQYKPCGRVGGDFYDVFRLDEQHFGLYVADAMGHGVPASLLTIFVKQGVRPKDIDGKTYRLVPPDEVLHRLNHDMIRQRLSETPFVTMVYALFNQQTGRLVLSRAGHPYPIYLPCTGPPELWQMEGSLLGVFDTRYHQLQRQLQPGDKLLFYTDGMDAAGFAQSPIGVPSLLAAAEAYRQLPIAELVARLTTDLFRQTRQNDDLTLLGLEIPRAE